MGTDCPQRVHCCLPSCWSAGSGFLKEVISDFGIEVVCTMHVVGLIRNFFKEVVGPRGKIFKNISSS